MRAFGLVLAAVGLALLAAVWTGGPARGGAASSSEIRIHFSRFTPSEVVATAGVPVQVTLVNTDPIEHEWLIGDAAFHDRHRHGTEAHHGARPNEISLKPLETVRTTLFFDAPGTQQYICHLPGHEAYGMVGTLTIT